MTVVVVTSFSEAVTVSDAAMPSLSPRQRVLFDRMVSLGEWAAAGELPFHVFEIGGFGSFFRGNQKSRDVEIVFRVERRPAPEFEEFLKLIHEMLYDRKGPNDFATPVECLRELIQHSEIDLHEDDARRYVAWLDGFSWNSLYPVTISRQHELARPITYARKMIRRLLPNLNVSAVQGEEFDLTEIAACSGFVASIWSWVATDTRANLFEAFSPDRILRNVQDDLAHFRMIQPMIQANRELLVAEVHAITRAERLQQPVNNHWDWLKAWSSSQPDLVERQRILTRAEKRLEKSKPRKTASDLNLSLEQATKKVEALWSEMKTHDQEIRILQDLRYNLLRFVNCEIREGVSWQRLIQCVMLERASLEYKRIVPPFLEKIGLELGGG